MKFISYLGIILIALKISLYITYCVNNIEYILLFTASSDLISPGTIAAQSTPSPLLLLSPLPEQRQLTLPLLSPLIPSVTTSTTMTTSAATEYNQHQQQLPTPNTFIRHCEDMGLFHDLQNIVVMSSLTGPSDDTTFTTVPITTTSTMVTTSAGQPGTSNVFSSSSNGVLTTMMMANPFDETFKQAVLQQQKTDGNPTENILSNNNNDGELNTPFIVPTTVVEISRNINNSCKLYIKNYCNQKYNWYFVNIKFFFKLI